MTTNRDETSVMSSLPPALSEGVIAVKSGETPELLVKADRLVEICEYLKSAPELGFNYLVNLTAVDWMNYFELVYHLHSIRHGRMVVLKARVDRDNPVVPSVAGVWDAANFQEREVFDLFGIRFDGHPDLRRILLYDEFAGHPLRKDYGLPREEASQPER